MKLYDRPVSNEPDSNDWAAMSDRALLAAARFGERDAFEVIVLLHGPGLLRYARSLLFDVGAAEQAVHDAFVAAWKGLDDLRADSALRPWLFSVFALEVTDHRRQYSTAPAEEWLVGRAELASNLDPSVPESNAALLLELDIALAELPYLQRACWLLDEIERLTPTEIGRIMTLPPRVVRRQANRARATLNDRMATWR